MKNGWWKLLRFPVQKGLKGEGRATLALSKVMDRFSELSRRRFGCRVEYFPRTQFDDNDLVKTLASGGNAVRLNQRLIFPISHSGRLIGIAAATETRTLLAREIQQLQEMISLVIAPVVGSMERLKEIDALESQIILDLSTNRMATSQLSADAPTSFESMGSVTRMSDYRKGQLWERNEEGQLEGKYSSSSDGRFDVSCWIESAQFEDRLRLALEIHERSGRFAFLFLEELGESSLSSQGDFVTVGPCTLYVPEVADLADSVLAAIAPLLVPDVSPQIPRFIIGTRWSLEDLRIQKPLSYELFRKSSLIHLRMQGSFNEYRQKQLLELMFSSESHLSC